MSAQARHQHPEPGQLGWEAAETDVVFSFLTGERPRMPAYPEWNAADVPRDLVCWYESFAAIVAGCADGSRPSAPGGNRVQVEARVPGLPYRRGGHRYTVGQRIGIAASEMRQHRRDVVRALLNTTAQRTCPVSPGDASGTADRAGDH